MVKSKFIFTSATEGEGGCVFTPLRPFVTCKIEYFSSILGQSIWLFCPSVAYRSQFETDRRETLLSCRGNLN